jgi:glycosyltransferase involved in cell wall biosynthesis
MISVVIPSFNSFGTIEHTLKSLLSQNRINLLSEIIIVDSSDDNQTKQLLSVYQSEKIKIINGGIKLMPAKTRNLGVKYAKGDILAFIDSDAIAAFDWLEKIADAYEKGIKVGGGSVLLPEFQKNRILPLTQYFFQCSEFMESKNIRQKRFVPTVNMFCERQLFDKIGGFPDIRASEDVLFGLEANRFSSVWFIPQIKVFHIFRENIKGSIKNQILLGKYIIIYKRLYDKDVFYYKGLWPLLMLPLFLVVKFCRISLRIFKTNLVYVLKYLFILPFFLLTLFFWSIGFINGIFSNMKITE